MIKKHHLEVFCKKGDDDDELFLMMIRCSLKFQENLHVCQSLFLIKLQDLGLQLY